jgi:hypothetical protein
MDKIDELLMDWYEWQRSYTPNLDYGRADPACRDFRISRQWMDFEDLNAEVEANQRAYIGKIIDPMIQKLDMRCRLAINTAMRNFGAGATVWVNPRHADTQDEDYERAKLVLCPKLVASGLLDKSACKPHEFAL